MKGRELGKTNFVTERGSGGRTTFTKDYSSSGTKGGKNCYRNSQEKRFRHWAQFLNRRVKNRRPSRYTKEQKGDSPPVKKKLLLGRKESRQSAVWRGLRNSPLESRGLVPSSKERGELINETRASAHLMQETSRKETYSGKNPSKKTRHWPAGKKKEQSTLSKRREAEKENRRHQGESKRGFPGPYHDRLARLQKKKKFGQRSICQWARRRACLPRTTGEKKAPLKRPKKVLHHNGKNHPRATIQRSLMDGGTLAGRKDHRGKDCPFFKEGTRGGGRGLLSLCNRNNGRSC